MCRYPSPLKLFKYMLRAPGIIRPKCVDFPAIAPHRIIKTGFFVDLKRTKQKSVSFTSIFCGQFFPPHDFFWPKITGRKMAFWGMPRGINPTLSA